MTTQNQRHKKWKNEMDASVLYRVLSEIEGENAKGKLFSQLAQESTEQASYWLPTPPSYTPGLKVKVLSSLIRKFGPHSFLDLLNAMKMRGLSVYKMKDQHEKVTKEGEEKIHSHVKHGTDLRAALFGINDGLVSNASLVFAMVGAQSETKTIILAGASGLLAGAFSMAAGEYISVQSQRDLYENQIDLERAELEEFPEDEARELSFIYQAKGLGKKEADDIAFNLVKNKEEALRTLAREELGLDPENLGSGLKAAGASFVAFSVGAFLPLIPFFFLSQKSAVSLSMALSGLALFSIGAGVSQFTGKSFLTSGLRMCALGFLAGISTFVLGRLLGA